MVDNFFIRTYGTLRAIYKPKYLLLNAIILVVYYYVFTALLSAQQYGIVLILFPVYLLYLLVISSSVAMTIGIYSIRNTRHNEAKEVSTGVGTATTLVGGVIGGCGCASPILFGFTAFGVSSGDIFALDNFISANQTAIFSLMIAINFFVVLYYLNKLSKPYCKIKGKRQ